MGETAHAYFTAKLCLVVFNLGRIIQRIVIFGFYVYDEGQREMEPYTINGTVIARLYTRLPMSIVIFTLMMFIGLHMLGVIGAIKENRRCLYTYATILMFINMVSLFSPTFNPSIFIIYLIMIILAIGYGFMLKQKEDHQRLYSSRIQA
uniref:Uncharacterized protein n=1 Tax=Tetranychus urticae TaxID=32264 RepID=T1KQG7_TETUR